MQFIIEESAPKAPLVQKTESWQNEKNKLSREQQVVTLIELRGWEGDDTMARLPKFDEQAASSLRAAGT